VCCVARLIRETTKNQKRTKRKKTRKKRHTIPKVENGIIHLTSPLPKSAVSFFFEKCIIGLFAGGILETSLWI
jgi:hypothetical protein